MESHFFSSECEFNLTFPIDGTWKQIHQILLKCNVHDHDNSHKISLAVATSYPNSCYIKEKTYNNIINHTS